MLPSSRPRCGVMVCNSSLVMDSFGESNEGSRSSLEEATHVTWAHGGGTDTCESGAGVPDLVDTQKPPFPEQLLHDFWVTSCSCCPWDSWRARWGEHGVLTPSQLYQYLAPGQDRPWLSTRCPSLPPPDSATPNHFSPWPQPRVLRAEWL